MRPNALPPDYRPYVWAPSSAEVAERHGLRREQVLRFDQNTPALPGVPQIPLASSFAQLCDYPDGTFARAPRGGCGIQRGRAGADRSRRGRRRADRALRADVPRARPQRGDRRADLRPVPDRLAAARGRRRRRPGRGRRDLDLQPEQPDGRAPQLRRDRVACACTSECGGRRRRGVLGVRRRHVRGARRRAAQPDRAADALEGIRPRRTAGRLCRGRARSWPRSSTAAGRRRASRRRPHGSRRQRCGSRASRSSRPSPSGSASAPLSPPRATTARGARQLRLAADGRAAR